MNPKKFFISLSIGLAALILAGCVAVLVITSSGLPSTEELERPKPELATTVLSTDGEILDQYFFSQRRTYIPIDSIPKDFTNALIATEDHEFYHHWGVHVMRIFKAVVKNILALHTREGASTITQQLARNLYLNQEMTLVRKIREAFTAVEIERRYTKREILELYANTVYFGRGAYGLQIASQLYFNKSPMELTTAQCAYMVALLKNPLGYDAGRSERAYNAGMRRRNIVLNNMVENGVLAPEQGEKDKATPITLTEPEETYRRMSIAPQFVEWIRQTVSKEDATDDSDLFQKLKGHDLYRDGLVIYTTLNAEMQRSANKAVQEHLAEFQPQFNKSWSWKGRQKLLDEFITHAIRDRREYIEANDEQKEHISKELRRNSEFVDSVKKAVTTIQAGFVVIEPYSGEVRAMVGSSRFGKKVQYTLNHVTQIRRQPGSSFKPFLYTAALEAGMTPESMVESGPFSYRLPSGEMWNLAARKEEAVGEIPLRTALKFSVNTVAARLITEHTSPHEVVRVAQRMGITSPLFAVPSIALGSVEVSPMEMTSAFCTFPNHGIYVAPYAITRIEDRNGNVIYERKRSNKIEDAISPRIARQMISMMKGVVNGGTASSIRKWYKYEAAGKTGTTNDFADAWFIGYTPRLCAGIWVGFDDQRVKFTGWYGQGGTAAAPVWGRFMEKVYKNPILKFNPYETFSDSDSTTVDDNTIVDPNTILPEDSIPINAVHPPVIHNADTSLKLNYENSRPQNNPHTLPANDPKQSPSLRPHAPQQSRELDKRLPDHPPTKLPKIN